MATIEFEDAPDLIPVVAKLIEEEKDVAFSHLTSRAFIYRRRKAKRSARWIARVSKVPSRFQDKFGDAIYVLEVDSSNFDLLTDTQKEAVLYHELCHTYRNDKDKYVLLRHEIEEFPKVIEKYGGYLPDTLRLINAIKNQLKTSTK